MADADTAARYELFLDESGTFEETSTDPAERGRAAGSRKFPSQLAGLLAPRGAVTEAAARDLLERGHRAAGIPFTGEVHGRDLRRGEAFDGLITALADGLDDRGWQPVRLVNVERVSFGDRRANYTNLVAELALRVFQQLRLEGRRRIDLGLRCARVMVGDEEMPSCDYLDRLHEYLSRAAVRQGMARESADWRIECFDLGSGRKEPELMVCDLLSNASHDRFHKVGSAVRDRLREAFGSYDLSLRVCAVLEEVDALIAGGSQGLALVRIAEQCAGGSLDQAVADRLLQRLRQGLDALAAHGAPARDPQLAIAGAWLEQTIAVARDLDSGARVARWLLRRVGSPLRERLAAGPDAATVDWFVLLVEHWLLTASNHAGDLATAHEVVGRLPDLLPALARRWDHLDLLFDAELARAVHLTDVRAFAEAADVATRIAGFYHDLGGLFADALPGVFPDQLHGRKRAEALGTALQAAMYAAFAGDSSFDAARNLSDQAIAEFDNAADRGRQRQYRCQLETLAGAFDTARAYLARALDLAEDTTHGAIAAAIAGAAGGDHGFLLLHWLRLGAFASRSGAGADFHAAALREQLFDTRWCKGEVSDHPAHSILRYRAELELASGNTHGATECLRHLRRICLPLRGRRTLTGFQLLACQALVARHVARSDKKHAARLAANDDREAPGLRELVGRAARELAAFPDLARELARWNEGIARIPNAWRLEPGDFDLLVGCAHRVAF